LLGAISPPSAAQAASEPTSTVRSLGDTSYPSSLPADPNVYVTQAIGHEIAALDKDHTYWRYHLHREDDKNNFDRDVIETKDGNLARTLLLWGRPLNPQERVSDQERMHRQVSDLDERAKHAKHEREDGAKARQMLRLLPQAFIFKYAGEQYGLVRLSFVPNPHFDPPNFEARVFRSLQGTLWIDRAAMRLAGVEGTLFEDVNFGWGLLGHLNKGGTFCVKQRDVGDGHWDVVSEEVNMVGRAVIFKTITRKQKQILSDFHRVPDSMTIEQAYQLLQKDSSSAAAAHTQDAAELRQ
jgi:hypothetical protein